MPAVCAHSGMPTGLPSRSFGDSDAAVGAHVERRMAEHARRKHRNADERRIALRGKADELAERHFGNVPFAVLDEPEEDFLDRQHEARQHDAFRPHHAIRQVADMVVIGGGQRQMQPRRAAALDDFRRALGARGRHPFASLTVISFASHRERAGLALAANLTPRQQPLYAEHRCR